jgi:predicted lipoprotein with Yx(FWY)xxD motif
MHRRGSPKGRLAPFVAMGSVALVAGAAFASSRPTKVATGRVFWSNNHSATVLVDSRAHSIYISTNDRKDKSRCTGSCVLTFKPLPTSGNVEAVKGSGVNPKLLGVINRGHHRLQVTYNHHPLYVSTSELKPGVSLLIGCRHFKARWYLINARGQAVKSKCPGY